MHHRQDTGSRVNSHSFSMTNKVPLKRDLVATAAGNSTTSGQTSHEKHPSVALGIILAYKEYKQRRKQQTQLIIGSLN